MVLLLSIEAARQRRGIDRYRLNNDARTNPASTSSAMTHSMSDEALLLALATGDLDQDTTQDVLLKRATAVSRESRGSIQGGEILQKYWSDKSSESTGSSSKSARQPAKAWLYPGAGPSDSNHCLCLAPAVLPG